MAGKWPELNDGAPLRGMNTLDETRSLSPVECVRLVNAKPGNPPIPRGGSVGYYISGTGLELRPPAVPFVYSGTVYLAVCIYDQSANTYKLAVINPATGAITYPDTLSFSASITPFFDLGELMQYIYAVGCDDDETESIAKVIEGPSTARSMYISDIISVSPAQVGDDATGVFSVGDCFGYNVTFVRLNIASAWEEGATPTNMVVPPNIAAAFTSPQPKVNLTYTPGIMESYEDARIRSLVEITNTGTTKYYVDVTAGIDLAGIVSGATHCRITRTRRQASLASAQSAQLYYLFDIPIVDYSAYYTYSDKISDNTLAAQTNKNITGYTQPPVARFIERAKSRNWLFSMSGVAYYSESPGGDGGSDLELAFDYPQKWGSFFKPALYYVNCDSEDGQKAAGMRILGDDLIFYKEAKCFALFGSDPTATVVRAISDTMGNAFPYSLTKAEIPGYFGKCHLFLSNHGPMVMQEGARPRLLSDFKIKTFWPDREDELYGELVTHRDWIINNCTAAYVKNQWVIMYKTYSGSIKMYSYFFNPLVDDNNAGRGPFEIEMAEFA